VNNARGGVAEAAAIPDAIASGQLAGAGIDVLETEPPPPDHR
jgi:phosphoglycerate dehydrogenase-like enzyme